MINYPIIFIWLANCKRFVSVQTTNEEEIFTINNVYIQQC